MHHTTLMTKSLSVTSALLLLLTACDDGGGSDGGDGGSSSGATSSSTTTSPGETTDPTAADTSSGTPQTSGTSSDGTSGASSSTSEGDTTTDEGSSGSTGGFPVDCEDGEPPVRVDGGGNYDTLQEAVAATAPGGSVLVCPGDYSVPEELIIDRDMRVTGAGRDEVRITVDESTYGLTIRDADVGFSGATLRGGTRTVNVEYTTEDPHSLVLEDLRITGSSSVGLTLFAGVAVPPDALDILVQEVTVEQLGTGGVIAAPPYAAVNVFELSARFVDCSLRDNQTENGALHLTNARVLFEGGEVVRNTAMASNGGGATFTPPAGPTLSPGTLTIVDSDWGEGGDQENTPNDVSCTFTLNTGWLGNPTNATCSLGIPDCCEAD